ncbi:MAG TPA: 23S rRNA (guanosine(2251)-2'-O)-methyltransferase RlmB [Candidatus Polarisedimenticolaceae bacterium]|nr:23S rRNA (guanosine(2251)-2'-O)-methyltransferase RlmB [Candidatus Polarisedimenticolaceae bacterium]
MTRGGEPRQEILYGLHPVLEALEAGSRTIDRLFVSREGGGHNLGRLLRAAREAGIPVTHLPREALGRKVGARAVHQGVAAVVAPSEYADADAVCAEAAGSSDGLLILLDGIEDPRNLGAVIRTAAAAGAHGVLLGTENTAGITPAVAKTAAGSLERIPVAREPALSRRIQSLKAAGFRVVALDPRARFPWDAESYRGRLAVVAGGEARGLRRGLLSAADVRVSLPLARAVESLNVSVAVGALLYEVVRQRRGTGS